MPLSLEMLLVTSLALACAYAVLHPVKLHNQALLSYVTCIQQK